MMMMLFMRLIFVGVFVRYCNAQHVICNRVVGYDMNTLLNAVEWKIETDMECLAHPASTCDFYVSFCQAGPHCFNQYSACEKPSTATNMTILGEHTTAPFHAYESGDRGFYAEFRRGPYQNVTNTTYCQPSLRINFICDLTAQWPLPSSDNETGNVPASAVDDVDYDPIDHCKTIIRVLYDGACFNGEDPSKNEGLSAGAIFLIILFTGALAYFIFGAMYNGLVKHRSGIHLLPNAQFWIGLPLFMIEGCRATITCCSAKSSKSSATYESV